MKEQSRGLCVIINNLNFEELVCRKGAEKDEAILTDLFASELYFTVEVKRDLKRDDIIKAAEDYGKKDHSKFDAFVFIIMTHGNYQDSIYGVDGRKARVEDIMSEFNGERCASLRGKPKLFFIQACRGSPVEWPCDADKGYDPDSTLSKGLCPQEADFLLAFSTAPGSLSWRDETGARFIQVSFTIYFHFSFLNCSSFFTCFCFSLSSSFIFFGESILIYTVDLTNPYVTTSLV